MVALPPVAARPMESTMNLSELPLIIEPEQLEVNLGEENLLVIDLSKREQYAHMHIPGAVHLDYGLIVRGQQA
jgi:thiosulfate/3-mercaptopyruvate sulfurtransferase